MKPHFLVLLLLPALLLAGDLLPSSYRKDAFLPYKEYPEYTLPAPVDGGRVHIVGEGMANGEWAGVYVNQQLLNVSVGANLTSVHWVHVYPNEIIKGEPVWVSFHSQDPLYDQMSTASVSVLDSQGNTLLEGEFALNSKPPVIVTYVTSYNVFQNYVIHMFNNDTTSSHTINSILFNGTDVGANLQPALPYVLPPSGQVMFLLKFPTDASRGDLWTISVQSDSSSSSPSTIGYGGRLNPEFFPVEIWPAGCPYPTANETTWEWDRNHGVDTFLIDSGSGKDCGLDPYTINNQLAPKYGFYTLPKYDVVNNTQFVMVDEVLAIFMADESDGSIDEGMQELLQKTNDMWARFPGQTTYQGGKTNRENGAFSGLTDIQGMDMYIAACAPHIQEVSFPPPTWGSYDYMRNTRLNHMPLTTWTYSQGFFHGWNGQLLRNTIWRDPDPAELEISLASVICGGGKGLMIFEDFYDVVDHGYADSWDRWGQFVHSLYGLRELLRLGDVVGVSGYGIGYVEVQNGKNDYTSDVTTIPTLIRTVDALIVLVVNVANNGGYSDVDCGAQSNVHWVTGPLDIDSVSVSFPSDFSSPSLDVFAVQNGEIITAPTYSSDSSSIKFGAFTLDPDVASSIFFVIASSGDVRDNIQQNLQSYPPPTGPQN